MVSILFSTFLIFCHGPDTTLFAGVQRLLITLETASTKPLFIDKSLAVSHVINKINYIRNIFEIEHNVKLQFFFFWRFDLVYEVAYVTENMCTPRKWPKSRKLCTHTHLILCAQYTVVRGCSLRWNGNSWTSRIIVVNLKKKKKNTVFLLHSKCYFF